MGFDGARGVKHGLASGVTSVSLGFSPIDRDGPRPGIGNQRAAFMRRKAELGFGS
jgi:hypothetical protein